MSISIKNKRSTMRLVVPLVAAAFLAACNGSSKNDDVETDTENRTFQITVTNLTANQPLSPLAVIAHKSGYHAFTEGSPASAGLEQLAESGANGDLLAEAAGYAEYLDSNSGTGAIGPGGSATVEVSVTEGSQTYLSIVSMLVNTNDGFTAADNYDISGLSVDESSSMTLPVWDAGTELNSEADGTIPGPANGGEGYSAARDDIVDFVAIHRGVISSDDGLSSSILNESHRFDNPAARLTVKRID
ncbi:spondin domain-containing protein [Leucothrix arctica]|nr:spondin domain-containing protein [Leucothrix arctica]